ncbi:type IX secretion system membrane protein PorP/SprF [Crocinitomix catalasitica]|nr:type IX secretion system membrane protein PorP/SprF [Crocinitomix catalasitica]
MKKNLLILAVFSLLMPEAKAQQTEHYTQYMFNQYAFNPAVAGTKKCIDIRLGYRYQWADFLDGPRVGFANVHAPIRFKKNKKKIFGPSSGAGLQIKRDKFGPFSFLQAHLAYALHLPVNRNWTISYGLAFGIKQTVFRVAELNTELVDPIMPGSAQQFILPDAQFGVWLNDKRTYFGFSIHNILGNRLKGIGNDAKLQRHFYLTAGRSFKLEKKWSFIPSLFTLYTINTPIDWNVTAIFDLDNKLALGVGLRRTDAITFQFRVKLLNLISIGYSFDFIISKLGKNSYYTHEMTAGFNSCSNYGSSGTVSCPVFE